MNTCGQSRSGRNFSSAPLPCEPNDMPSMALAMAYVPMQQFKTVYEPNEALQYGTIFPELNKPFLGWKGGCRR